MNHERSEKPMNHAALEPVFTMPNGGSCSRCQARKKDGVQCGSPARNGFSVCSRHGAGFPSREAKGLALPAGRPVVHGLYSKSGQQSIHEFMLDVEAAGNLKNTDKELTALKAALWFLLDQSDKRQEASTHLRELLEHLKGVRPSNLEDIQALRALIGEARGLQSQLDSWLSRVQDGAGQVMSAAKIQADILVRTADARASENFAAFTKALRGILWDVVDDPEKLSVFEIRVQKEIFAPIRARIEFEKLAVKTQDQN